MKKLLQINSVANTGSTGRIAEQIGNKVMEKGWESYIAYGRGNSSSNSKLIKIGNKWSLASHLYKSKAHGKHGLGSYRATKNLIKVIKEIKPDIVQIHNLHGYYVNFPLLLNYLNGNSIPTVITLHDFWLITGHCAYIHESCAKWKHGCGDCSRLSAYPSALKDNSLDNWIRKKELFDKMQNVTLVPVSNWVVTRLEHSFLKKKPTNVIHNGIDTQKFYPDHTSSEFVNPDNFNILCVATKWTDSNGFNDLLHLASLLDSRSRIIIVGVDESQLKSLPANMIGIKRTESIEELRRLYSQADIFLNPNKEVTFGLVTAEAMACGTPSIVYRDTAGEEIIDAATGYVIDDITDVVKILEEFRDENREKIANLCRKRICDKFNLDSQLEAYYKLYSQLTDEKGADSFAKF